MKVNLHVYPSTMTHESRIERETELIDSLELFSSIYVAGTAAEDLPEVEDWTGNRQVHRLSAGDKSGYRFKGIGKTIAFSRALLSRYSQEPIEVINCHSVAVLPVCVELKRRTGAVLIYDTHELETESASAKGLKKLLYKAIERRGIRQVDHVFVVTESIAEWYRRTYGIHNIDAIYNYPSKRQSGYDYPSKRQSELDVGCGYFQKKFNLSKASRIFIYQGVLAEGRGLEQIHATFVNPPTPNDYVVFVGYGSWEQKVRGWSAQNTNILYHPPVVMGDLARLTREADIGLALTEGAQALSYQMSAPNKLFQYWHAGIPAIVSRLPEHFRYLERYPAGVMTRGSTRDDLLDAIAELEEQDLENVNSVLQSARRKLNWEQYGATFRTVYETLLEEKAKG